MSATKRVAQLASKLPAHDKRNVLVTSALPYVNNVPHLGNLIGCVLSADVFARFARLRGHNVLYVCGTDEYGTATETKAREEGVTPREICDKYHAIHKQVYDWFNIDFDVFGRTTTEQQTRIAQQIFLRAHKEGFVQEKEIEQLWCETDSMPLADRLVNGTCPDCGYEDARGDQCDGCGHLINATELLKPRCSMCGNAPVVRQSKHLFLDLSTLQGELEDWVAETAESGKWTKNSVAITEHWLKGGLEPRCITRDLKWGTPVPLPGYENKVFYVWFDAPIGYVSITAKGLEDAAVDSGADLEEAKELYKQWWQPADGSPDVELYQFMGKDNVTFHTVIFPSTLLATREKWTKLKTLSTTEYLNYQDGKFSKSRGTGVFGADCAQTELPPCVWRAYLLHNRPEHSDTAFMWENLQSMNNSLLLNNLGNFCLRPLKFLQKFYHGVVPAVRESDLADEDKAVLAELATIYAQYVQEMEEVKIRAGVQSVFALSALGNRYMQEQAPWKLADRPERRNVVMAVATQIVSTLLPLLQPIVPSVTAQLAEQLALTPQQLEEMMQLPCEWTPKFELFNGHKLGEPAPLFRTIGDDEVKALRLRFGGEQARQNMLPLVEFPLDLAVGKLKDLAPLGDTGMLLGKADVGNFSKPVAVPVDAGLTNDDLVLVLANVKKFKIGGESLRSVVLKDATGAPVRVGADVEVGTRLRPTRSKAPEKLRDVNVKTVQLALSGNEEGVLTWHYAGEKKKGKKGACDPQDLDFDAGVLGAVDLSVGDFSFFGPQ